MNSKFKKLSGWLAVAVVLAGLVALVGPVATGDQVAQAESSNSDEAVQSPSTGNVPVLPPDSKPYRKSYGKWGAEWWKWALSIPAENNPTLATGNVDCQKGQSGDVYFLAGFVSSTTEPQQGERICEIPSDKALFFPVLNIECSTVEAPPFFGKNQKELRECVEAFFPGHEVLEVTIDGNPVPDLEQYRAQSSLFHFKMPAEDNILGLPGISKGQSVTDGFWLFLAPLSKGKHTIYIKGAYGDESPGFGFQTEVIYHLTVGE